MLSARYSVLATSILMLVPFCAAAESLNSQPKVRVQGNAALMAPNDADSLLRKYESIPGNGRLKSEVVIHKPNDSAVILRRYGSMPGGVVLEGAASGLPRFSSVSYDRNRNAFVFDNGVTYFAPVTATAAASLCDAISKDDRIGVSLGEEKEIVYGEIAADSEIAIRLKLLDSFLGDIILPPQYWTLGYRYAGSFKPGGSEQDDLPAVLFRFDKFELRVDRGMLKLASVELQIRLVPLSDRVAKDGGYLPDLDRNASQRIGRAYLVNARHVADNIEYYARESVVRQVLGYGEMAAFCRALKALKVDMVELGERLKAASAFGSVYWPRPATLDVAWEHYLREIETENRFQNWSSPPYELFLARQLLVPFRAHRQSLARSSVSR